MIRLYHGSFTVVEHPLVSVGRQELDFGPGFYLTSFRDQAERWAKRVCIIKNQPTPFLCSYTLDNSLLPNTIRKLLLNKYDIEWLDFIVASRKGQKPWDNFDIIEGGVANDQVIDTVEDYYVGRIIAEQAIGQLKFAKPSHQMCIRSQLVVDQFLHFEGHEILNKKGG